MCNEIFKLTLRVYNSTRIKTAGDFFLNENRIAGARCDISLKAIKLSDGLNHDLLRPSIILYPGQRQPELLSLPDFLGK